MRPGFTGLRRADQCHNNECRMRNMTKLEEDEDGRERQKKSNRDKIGNCRKVSRGVSKKIQHSDGPGRSTSESLWRLRTKMVQEEADREVPRQNQDEPPD